MKSKLWAAAELIERYGWLQHDLGNKNRGFCMMGALNQVVSLEGTDEYCALENLCPNLWISHTNDYLLESQTEAILLLGFAACLEDDGAQVRRNEIQNGDR